MAGIKFNFTGKFANALKKDAHKQIVQDSFRPFMKLSTEKVTGEVQKHAPKNFGIGVNSIRPTVSQDGMTGRVGTPLLYMLVMDKGRKAKHAPIAPLTLWAMRKFRLGIAGIKEARSIAFAVSKTMAKKGLKPRKFFDKGIKDSKDAVIRLLKQGASLAIKRLGGIA